MSSQLTSGWMRRESRSRPAAFCARAPARRSSGSSGRPARLACSRAAVAARETCSGPSRNCAVTTVGSRSAGASPSRLARHISWRSLAPGGESSTSSGTPRDQSDPSSSCRSAPRASRLRRSAGREPARGRASASIGPATRPAFTSRASRTATSASVATSSFGTRRARSSAITALPSSAKAAAASARPEDPARSRTYVRVAPALIARARATGSPPWLGHVSARSPDSDGSMWSSPSRCMATRSGTRSERVRNGRSGSSTQDEPAVDERSAAGQPAARSGDGRGAAGKLEREPDARAAARDVVVQVAVEPLEPGVEVGGEGDQQQLDVERLELEGPGERAQAQVRRPRPRPRRRRAPPRAACPPPAPTGRASPRARADARRDPRRGRGRGTDRRDSGRTPRRARDRGAHPGLDHAEPAEQMRERRVSALSHAATGCRGSRSGARARPDSRP